MNPGASCWKSRRLSGRHSAPLPLDPVVHLRWAVFFQTGLYIAQAADPFTAQEETFRRLLRVFDSLRPRLQIRNRRVPSARPEHEKEVGMKTVREIMSAEVTTLGRNDTLQLAQDIMTLGRVRHFPVLEDGEVVGVMSQRDLYKASLGSVMKYGEKAQREFLDTIAVKEVMHYPPVTTTPQASVKEAARLMLGEKIGCLPVIDGAELVGIVTETDMLKLVAEME